jgi:hypothetical protein
MINLVKQKVIFWIIQQQDLGKDDDSIGVSLKEAKYPKKVVSHLLELSMIYRRAILASYFISIFILVSVLV